MRIVKKTTDNKFLNIFEVTDPETHCKGYQYAERRGKDSIAFICYHKQTKKFLINHEFTPPNGTFMDRAFGGSLDKEGKDYTDIVIEEVKEEAGYNVTKENVYLVGNCFVSTQMNQRCYLYFVIVDNHLETERAPENEMEKIAIPTWVSMATILSGDDWKAIVIVMKAVRDLNIMSKAVDLKDFK